MKWRYEWKRGDDETGGTSEARWQWEKWQRYVCTSEAIREKQYDDESDNNEMTIRGKQDDSESDDNEMMVRVVKQDDDASDDIRGKQDDGSESDDNEMKMRWWYEWS